MKFEKETLEKAIAESLTINAAIIRMGGASTAKSYKVFKKKVEQWGLNIDHFQSHSECIKALMINGKILKLKNEEIFNENSLVSRGTVKRRVIEEKLIEYKCFKCENEGEWLGEKITLILDHKNGVNNDNRIENLRFACPNCNSTLPTHCLGSKGINKQEKIDKRTIPQNREIYRKIKDRPSKDVLSKDIKELGFKGTGRKYGVSDNAIRKWVKPK